MLNKALCRSLNADKFTFTTNITIAFVLNNFLYRTTLHTYMLLMLLCVVQCSATGLEFCYEQIFLNLKLILDDLE